MLEMFDCKGPQKSLIATICSKAGSGVPKPLVTVLSMQLLQILHCSVITNPRFSQLPLAANSDVQLLFHLQCLLKCKIK